MYWTSFLCFFPAIQSVVDEDYSLLEYDAALTGNLLIIILRGLFLLSCRPDHDHQHCYHQAPTVNQRLLLQLL